LKGIYRSHLGIDCFEWVRWKQFERDKRQSTYFHHTDESKESVEKDKYNCRLTTVDSHAYFVPVLTVLAKTSPTELVFALGANHMLTPAVFLYHDAALRTWLGNQHLSQVVNEVFVRDWDQTGQKCPQREGLSLQRISPLCFALLTRKGLCALDVVGSAVNLDSASIVALLVWTVSHVFATNQVVLKLQLSQG